VVASVDVSYGGEAGFREAVAATRNILRRVGINRESTILEAAFQRMATDASSVAVGMAEVTAALTAGAAASVIATRQVLSTDAPLTQLCQASGATLTAVSVATNEGVQLEKGLGGILAELRYPMDFDLSGSQEENEDGEHFDLDKYEI